MRCEFSETQFAFCYTFEILKTYSKQLLAPWFPTTVQEGRVGGWDMAAKFQNSFPKNVQLTSGSLFLQFKRPVFLKSNKLYQIEIKGKQLELLKQLNLASNLIYYCAPLFHEKDKILEYYTSGEIEKNSVLFSITAFGAVSGDHKLQYVLGKNELDKYNLEEMNLRGEATGRYGLLFSEPKLIQVVPNIFPDHRFPKAKLLSTRSDELFEIIKKFHKNIRDVPADKSITDLVFSILLIHHNILWIPLL